MRTRPAFTLVELLVVIGIVAAVLAIILPAFARAWDVARTTRCASNLHQLSVAMATYAAQCHGWYPPNVGSPAARYWYDDDRIGNLLRAAPPPVPNLKPVGAAFICPADGPGPAQLSYAMNVWASSAVDASVVTNAKGTECCWSPRVRYASRMILLTEAFSNTGTAAAGYYASPTVGVQSAAGVAPLYAAVATTPGQRFGGAAGVVCPAGRLGKPTCELAYYRHRTAGPAGQVLLAKGRVNVAYADGHVSVRSAADLVLPSGVATGDSCWSPDDLGGD